MPLDVSQVIQLAGDLGKAGARVGSKVAAATRSNGAELKAKAQALAPRRTGTLAGSLTVSVTGNGNAGAISAEVGTDVPYAVFQEYGTAKMAPQPFLNPALDAQTSPYTSAVEKAAEGLL